MKKRGKKKNFEYDYQKLNKTSFEDYQAQLYRNVENYYEFVFDLFGIPIKERYEMRNKRVVQQGEIDFLIQDREILTLSNFDTMDDEGKIGLKFKIQIPYLGSDDDDVYEEFLDKAVSILTFNMQPKDKDDNQTVTT